MKLGDEICSIDFSKKLKELGIKQTSQFYYYKNTCNETLIKCIDYNYPETDRDIFLNKNPESISAFNIIELLSMISQRIGTKENEPFNVFSFDMKMHLVYEDERFKRVYNVNYYADTVAFNTDQSFPCYRKKLISPSIYNENLPNSLAMLIIYLIEKNLHDKIKVIS